MTITTTSEGSGLGVFFEDTSGGFLTLTITHPAYVSVHKLHVLPFAAGANAPYNSPPAGTVANLEQEMNNIISLLKACYHSTTNVAFSAITQIQADGLTTSPFPYIFTGADSAAGTAAGSDATAAYVLDLVSKGGDNDRWHLALPGVASGVSNGVGRYIADSAGTAAVQALAKYLDGTTNGPVQAAKTNVVAHSGSPIQAPIVGIESTWKRIRRRLKVS